MIGLGVEAMVAVGCGVDVLTRVGIAEEHPDSDAVIIRMAGIHFSDKRLTIPPSLFSDYSVQVTLP